LNKRVVRIDRLYEIRIRGERFSQGDEDSLSSFATGAELNDLENQGIVELKTVPKKKPKNEAKGSNDSE
jgi:hypothetical protein